MVTEEVIELELTLPDPFQFEPGQYIRLTLPELSLDCLGGNTRDFSIISFPEEKNTIRVAFKKSESLFKQFLFKNSSKTEFLLQGPLGKFIYPKDLTPPVIFIAMGLGITPLLSMLRNFKYTNSEVNLQIIWIYSPKEKIPYRNEIQEIIHALHNIKFSVIEKSKNLRSLLSQLEFSGETSWYICGPPKGVFFTARELQIQLEVYPEKIYSEEYPGYDSDNKEYKIFPPIENLLQYKDLGELVQSSIFSLALLTALNKSSLVAITDTQGSILYVNDKFMEVSKYSKEELIGQNHRILKSGFHLPQLYKDLWQTISKGDLWRGELKNRAKDGSFYWVDAMILPIQKEGQEVTHYLSVRYLLTEQKNLESVRSAVLNILDDFADERIKNLALSMRYELATQSAGIGVWEWNIELNEWIANDVTYQIFESTADEFRSPMKAWRHLLALENKELVLKKFFELKKSEDNFIINVPIEVSTGQKKIIRVVSTAASDKNNTVKLTGVLWDITREAESDQMKSDFISVASHQLRTPLTAIRWYSEILLKDLQDKIPVEDRHLLLGLVDSSARMADLISALLNISKIESGRLNVNPEPCNLRELLNHTLYVLDHEREEKKISIEVHCPEDLPVIKVDPKLINEIYQNLISNAVRYTPNEGEIKIDFSHDEKNIFFHIKDTGYGIPIHAKDKIFKKFYRADNILDKVTNGTGLGLYLTKVLLEISGGKIWFKSEEGRGSTFSFSLPKIGSKQQKGIVLVE